MTGYHEVKAFPYFPDTGRALKLPEGWKPYDSVISFDHLDRLTIYVLARKWNRAESPA